MTDTVNLAGAFIAGIVLGALFFGGLWWSTRKGLVSDNPALWFLGSLLLRTGMMLAGFYLVGSDDWRRALSCLAGFIVARFAVLRLSRTLVLSPAAAPEVP